MSQHTDYVEKMQNQVDKLTQKMEKLEASAHDAREEAQQSYKEQMTKLRQQSKATVAKLDEIKAAGVDSWETLVTDMEKMHDSFTHAFFSMLQPLAASETTAAKPGDTSAHKKA